MKRIILVLTGLSALVFFLTLSMAPDIRSGLAQAQAPEAKAEQVRKANALAPFTPPDSFLAGVFLADETDPCYLFGSVRDFVASRPCPATWLIEEGEKARIAKPASPDQPLEYTLWLEEACPGGVVHYVFVDQSALTPKQWLEWRRQFHKNKAEGQYGAAKDRLDKAVADGMKVAGEMRFIMRNGELSGKPAEEALRSDIGFSACYDLKLGEKLKK